jgi:hypothetical protein
MHIRTTRKRHAGKTREREEAGTCSKAKEPFSVMLPRFINIAG